jgi:hypothetical protein
MLGCQRIGQESVSLIEMFLHEPQIMIENIRTGEPYTGANLMFPLSPKH